MDIQREQLEQLGFSLPDRVTNYDRIISKTPEELAEYFRVVVDCEFCPAVVSTRECTDGKYCMERWLDWMRQEVNS